MIGSFILVAATAVASAASELAFTNEHSILRFDRSGQIVSVSERESGRELLERAGPFAAVRDVKSGGYRYADSIRSKDGCLVFGFSGGGEAVVRPEPFKGGMTFRIVGLSAPDCDDLCIGRMIPAPKKWTGMRANMASDEKSGLCLRAYDIYSEMSCTGGVLKVRIPASKAVGSRIGIVGAPRAGLRSALKEMTLVSGRPYSAVGGAWAQESEAVRGSYLNANVTAASVDDWIELAERGGFDVIHFREIWYASRGHYPVNTNYWPGGLAEMKKAVAKIKAAGYRAGLHTLTGCIDPKDPWVSGPENSELLAIESYTLSEDISATADEMTVNEPPRVRHDVVFTYSGSGNAIRIGNEIVQYTGFTDTPPYRYTGLKRGAFGTKASAHSKGDVAGYLRQRYIAFYPDPDTPLADKVADAIAEVYNTCGFDMIYCDGTEGMGTFYGAATMRDKIISHCTSSGRICLNEDSMGRATPAWAHTWWYHSRVGAWDWCYWAPKRFFDLHVERMHRDNVRNADLLEVQMGWWAPILSNERHPAQKLDEMEYYASRNAGLDASMSISRIDVVWSELRFHISRLVTVLGWYERARRARAFRPEVRESFDRNRAEFRLRQNRFSGVWEVSPVKVSSFRSHSPETEKLVVSSDEPSAKSVLRVEALYAGERVTKDNLTVLTSGIKADDLVMDVADPAVSIKAEDSRLPDGGRAFRLTAENRGKTRRGAWARASAMFSPYRKIGKRIVMRFSVKGDGSGALLNVQPETPFEYGQSLGEHYVTLDFTGWREFEMPLRERDAERYSDYEWPYKGYAVVFHRIIRGENVSAVNFYLNDIPAGGKATVEVSDVSFVPQRKLDIVRHEVKVNSTAIEVPFEMKSGEYAELEDGFWVLYSANGDPLFRKRSMQQVPLLKAGSNEISYRGETADGTRPRAEVTFFAIGACKEAMRPLAELAPEARKLLAYEAEDPRYYAPEKGLGDIASLVTRPGEKASLEVIVYGPMPECTLRTGDFSTAIPAVEKGIHRRFVLTGEYSGVIPVSVKRKNPAEPATARFEFIKRYR